MKNIQRLLVCWFAGLLVFLSAGWLVLPAIGEAEVVERVVAVVGDEIITLYDVESTMAPRLNEIKRAQNRDMAYKTVRRETIEELINDRLLKQSIENAKIAVTNDELSRMIRDILARNQITVDILKSELITKGISFESYKEDLKGDIQKLKFVNQEIGPKIKISDQDMRDYYDKHMAEFGVHQPVHIAQIVLPFDETLTKAKAVELKNKATEIASQARSGTSFSSLAKEHSKGPNTGQGGDLGIVDPSNLMPEIVAALENMRPGQISDPVISSAGIHIIYLIDRAKATDADFEKLKDQIYRRMYDQAALDELNRYLAEVRKKTYVEIKD